ncbi:MmcB family DNA repair protein [Thalassobaculum sp. OXR-137]|uniref:MmcB family DNA repair protein n=1 Tax=Thalassobaculum sp. OXR-137 TaxID=3100173 RepID=UPI002AC94BF2|nr:MmcB family DNA repair protein [Thalassobaculum sp. OXR-137]WPZ35251.1 MmcB family DNA repair protein [Thalassobaculum sp. OXR-137]
MSGTPWPETDGDGAAAITRAVTRGAARLFEDLGQAVVTELRLANGRRADIVALAPDGTVTIVEVKSGIPDFAADGKWAEYGPFCDRFFFAVSPEFPVERLPDAGICGLIVADAWGAEILRDAPVVRLAAARRKAITLRFAATAARRLRSLEDPRL